MMNKGWLVGMVLLLNACSSTEPKVYYQLPSPPSSAASTPRDLATTRTIWLSSMTLGDALSSSGVVYQTSDVRRVIASNNLWASPLDQQLQQSLMTHLNTRLTGWVASAQPLGNDPATLQVTVTAFQGRYDGKAVVQGEWMLHERGRVMRQAFSVELPQSADGYDALVKTLAQGWQQVAFSIADQIQRAG